MSPHNSIPKYDKEFSLLISIQSNIFMSAIYIILEFSYIIFGEKNEEFIINVLLEMADNFEAKFFHDKKEKYWPVSSLIRNSLLLHHAVYRISD